MGGTYQRCKQQQQQWFGLAKILDLCKSFQSSSPDLGRVENSVGPMIQRGKDDKTDFMTNIGQLTSVSLNQVFIFFVLLIAGSAAAIVAALAEFSIMNTELIAP